MLSQDQEPVVQRELPSVRSDGVSAGAALTPRMAQLLFPSVNFLNCEVVAGSHPSTKLP